MKTDQRQAARELVRRWVRAHVRAPVKLDCRVLVVEDGNANGRFLSVLLEKAGANVSHAENGEEAVSKVLRSPAASEPDRQRPFDVILMDMHMPVMDGYVATRMLRDAGYDGPIIALTGHDRVYDRQKCLDAGCDDYMTKSIDRHELVATVARYAETGSALCPKVVGSPAEE